MASKYRITIPMASKKDKPRIGLRNEKYAETKLKGYAIDPHRNRQRGRGYTA